MNMHNFPLGPAKPGDGPTPDRDCSASPGQGLPSGSRLLAQTRACRARRNIDPESRRALSPITAGPAALRDALFRCADAMADGFGRDWEREEIDRRARAWEQRQRHG